MNEHNKTNILSQITSGIRDAFVGSELADPQCLQTFLEGSNSDVLATVMGDIRCVLENSLIHTF
jgi:hypothetical protein